MEALGFGVFRALGFKACGLGLCGVQGRRAELRLFWVVALGLRCCNSHYIWEFPKIGVPYFGALIIRILLFRALY